MEDADIKMIQPDKNAYPNIELRYYYDHERYIENAPPQIRDFRETVPQKKGGILRSLSDTPSKLMLLITIVVLCAVILVITQLF